MCGINGVINFHSPINQGKEITKKMNQALAHRGPDAEGIFEYQRKTVYFGNTRLSIVDLDHGHQPILIKYKNHEYAITFNGEIYNFPAIKKQLNYQFKTNCDTEVLLVAYLKWGPKCLDKLNGQFALAIFDSKKQQVFMARDRLGIKPFYYTQLPDKTFLFTSEPKAILSYPGYQPQPDLDAIADFFLTLQIFSEGLIPLNKTFYKNIHALEPGTYAILNKKNLTIKKYWQLEINPNQYIPNTLKNNLQQAIDIRIPQQVKFGTALSGGLDSSIITQHIKQPIVSATIKKDPDWQHAKLLTQQKKNITHLSVNPSPQEMIKNIDQMIRSMDAPHSGSRQLYLYSIYQTLKQAKCKVALIGEGSDEFNMGYSCYYPQLQNFSQLIKSKTKTAQKYLTPQINWSPIIKSNLDNPESDPLEQLRYFFSTKFLKYRLDANDTCAMAHSIEARTPFCDHRLVEVSLSISASEQLKNNTEKYILKQEFKNDLPQQIISRQKSPLPEPDDKIFYQLVSQELDKNIQQANTKVWQILNKDYISNLKNLPDTKIKHLFSVLSFLRWYKINFT